VGRAGSSARLTNPRELPFAEWIALQIEGVEAFRPKEGNQHLAVGRGHRVRVGRLRVPLDRGRFLEHGVPPQFLTRPLVEGKDEEMLWRLAHNRCDVAVEADLQRRFAALGHGCGEEQPVAPDDGARVAEPGDRHAEADVLAGLHVPGGRRHSRALAVCCVAAERRPVVSGAGEYRARGEEDGGGKHQSERRGSGCGFHRPSMFDPAVRTSGAREDAASSLVTSSV